MKLQDPNMALTTVPMEFRLSKVWTHYELSIVKNDPHGGGKGLYEIAVSRQRNDRTGIESRTGDRKRIAEDDVNEIHPTTQLTKKGIQQQLTLNQRSPCAG